MKDRDRYDDGEALGIKKEETHTALYAVLNVSPDASRADIQKAFKRLSRVFHPDKRVRLGVSTQNNGTNSMAEEAFQTIRQAHDVLSDPVLRLTYDYAGMLAVELLLRSHLARGDRNEPRGSHDESSRSTTTNKNEEDSDAEDPWDQDDDDDDDDEGNSLDLYVQVRDAPSYQYATQILDDALYRVQSHQASSRTHSLNGSLAFPHVLGGGGTQDGFWEQDRGSLQWQTKRQVSAQWTATLGAGSEVSRTAQTEMSTQLSLAYTRPGYGPVGSVDVISSSRMPAAPVVKIQSGRTLANQTNVLFSLAGSVDNPETWTYSFMSSRNILWNSPSSERRKQSHSDPSSPKTIHASWQLGISLLGKLQYFRVELRQPTLPHKWSARIGLDALAGTYETATYTVSYARHWMWTRWKALWHHKWADDWTFSYGLAFDGRGRLMGLPGRTPCWKALCSLSSSNWDIKVPVTIAPSLEGSVVAGLASVWIAEFLDEQTERWYTYSKRKLSRGRGRHPSALHQEQGTIAWSHQSHSFRALVRDVASKKRTHELQRHGLVILRATWCPATTDCSTNRMADDEVDVTDAMQFWTVTGRLYWPVPERPGWSVPSSLVSSNHALAENRTSWGAGWPWSRWIQGGGGDHNGGRRNECVGSWKARYRYGTDVFEMVWAGDERVRLPDPRATRLGSADVVQ